MVMGKFGEIVEEKPAKYKSSLSFGVSGKTPRFSMGLTPDTSKDEDLGTYAAKESIKANIGIKTAKKKEEMMSEEKLGKAGNLVSNYFKRLYEIPTGRGLGGIIGGQIKRAEAAVPIGPEAAKVAGYSGLVGGTRIQLARALGDVGRVPIQELQTVVNLIPSYTDNAETQSQKALNLKNFLQDLGVKLKPDQEKAMNNVIYRGQGKSEYQPIMYAKNKKTGKREFQSGDGGKTWQRIQ